MKQNTSFIPQYDFSPALNAGYLKEILPLLVKHNIAANPINYAICYDYVIGDNPELSKAVDSMIAAEKAFDCEASVELYKKHVCNASLESFEKISSRIQQVIEQAAGSIDETCNQAEVSNHRFQKKTAILESVSEAVAINSILQEIIEETNALAETSQAMQRKLKEANQEMDRLRQELVQVRQTAATDGLTGLLNRRAFDQALAEIIGQPGGANTHLSLLDIDHFKRINDTYGHTIGDNVIKYVATVMKKNAEAHHRVARYGGEELAIIMPDTTRERAVEISEKIRSALEVSRLKRKDNGQPLGAITISIGIAGLLAGDNVESLIVRADKALYRAKDSGRNRVVYGL